MLGSLILYLKGMRIMMFQLSGFYYKGSPILSSPPSRNAPKRILASLEGRLQGLGFWDRRSGFRTVELRFGTTKFRDFGFPIETSALNLEP